MDSTAITPNLTIFRVNGWQLYAWRDCDSVTLIDTGAPESGAELRESAGASVAPTRFGRAAIHCASGTCGP
jgi:hypothetical protein